MQICDHCFNDEEMQKAVRNESRQIGKCDACGQTSHLVEAEFFQDFFEEVLSLFMPDENGIDVTHFLQQDWNLFIDFEVGKNILDYYLNLRDFGFKINDKVSYGDNLKEKISIWDDLKKQVKEKSRFFTSLSSFDDLQLIKQNAQIEKDTILYRARVIPSGKKFLTKDDMGCPPKSVTPAGRANPAGIPYLYLCQEEETTYYEVRSLYLDKLTIGKFIVNKELQILDFTNPFSLYHAYGFSDKSFVDEISNQRILRLISFDLSKPLRRYDTELEYIPTQLICEYCKLNGIDGIRFNSSLHKGGVNVVLFDAGNATCVKVSTREIKRVTIER